ncbi:hypothetical protein A176_002402 [Myxococcus hansupus]|uniref:ImpA N-terminal domain-containing protein n=1 Tax=Pseudomyxococcus hansupus TaxID=1297742 RepID=A0A0H4WVZ3_9BACT|nr:type VI secretion system protein IglI family protein [Myxococcus hansupus]AKQ65490.1 hypothetical protein A176_002402 [Myxococcus hansupus]
MRELNLCLRPFDTDSERLEAHDPRFQHIADLVQKGEYTQAADAVESLLAEGVHEVRLLSYFLYAVFHEEGLGRMPAILETLTTLIQRVTAALAPGDKQGVFLNKAVTWLGQTLLDVLRYHQSKRDARWGDWLRSLTSAQASDAVQRAQEAVALLSGPRNRTGAEALSRLVQWLRDFKTQLEANQPEEAPAPAPTQEPAAKAPPPEAAPAPPSAFIQLGQMLQLRGSAHLVELCNKLKAFELLIAREDFQKAAMVSDDILGTLEAFDPRRYFPDLFATFGALLNKHVQQIHGHWENKDSMEWKALAQFYQVDLERFVRKD